MTTPTFPQGGQLSYVGQKWPKNFDLHPSLLQCETISGSSSADNFGKPNCLFTIFKCIIMDSFITDTVLKNLSITPKEEQLEAISSYYSKGHDTIFIAPTGFGKSILYEAAPFLYDSHLYNNKPTNTNTTSSQADSILASSTPHKAPLEDLAEQLQDSLSSTPVCSKKYMYVTKYVSV